MSAHDESGLGMVEVVIAMFVLVVAVMALMASYDESFVSLHTSAKTSSASLIAQDQLELYGTLAYTAVGLDATAFAAVDAVYTSDEAGLEGPTGTDHTIASCGSAANCLPIQTVTGSDGKSYRLETFVRDIPSGAGWSERSVTVIVRDLSTSGHPVASEETTAIDPGPDGPS